MKSELDAGEHVVVMGVTPPVTVGVSVTASGLPSAEVNTGEGHAITKVWLDGTCPETSAEAPTE
jgi:hypothetical protein